MYFQSIIDNLIINCYLCLLLHLVLTRLSISLKVKINYSYAPCLFNLILLFTLEPSLCFCFSSSLFVYNYVAFSVLPQLQSLSLNIVTM